MGISIQSNPQQFDREATSKVIADTGHWTSCGHNVSEVIE